ncbi:hypothetical protein H0H87_012568 [Tephrocybe sp. NHM501043]|nr:hypothetical protein H0H87_012568 [Tephrocybe sp. NHM501043]
MHGDGSIAGDVVHPGAGQKVAGPRHGAYIVVVAKQGAGCKEDKDSKLGGKEEYSMEEAVEHLSSGRAKGMAGKVDVEARVVDGVEVGNQHGDVICKSVCIVGVSQDGVEAAPTQKQWHNIVDVTLKQDAGDVGGITDMKCTMEEEDKGGT